MAKILIVDDSEAERKIVSIYLEKEGEWSTMEAESGIDALCLLDQDDTDLPDVVITDLIMPEMDGLELVENIRKKYPGLPVILMTGYGGEDVVTQALHKGAASYVPKDDLEKDLASNVAAVLDMTRTARQEQHIQQYLVESESSFIIDNNPDLIGPLIGYLQKMLGQMHLCDEADQMQAGIALGEALANAIYHGNLELDSTLRQTDNSAYYRLAYERSAKLPYRNRSIFITVRLSREEAVFIIRDEGSGFDPASVPDPTNPENLDKLSGRGLLLIRTFMDEISHNPLGNEITMRIRRRP